MKPKKRLSLFRIAAGAVLIATLTLWGVGGFHSGWTQTSVTETHYDEITEIAYPVRRDAFVAGVDVLAAGLLASCGLVGISCLSAYFKK